MTESETPDRPEGAQPDLIGTVFAGRYRIISVLGRGAMGTVYLGEHIKIGRKTAIKVLHASGRDEETIARFTRGSRNAARIDHPNVCRVFDFGDPPGGLHFLAMEYIEGESLYDLVAREVALPPARATSIAKQTADALQAAHDLGIVHRDLKPGNIMLTRAHDGSEHVKVVDFDIAKGSGTSEEPELTSLGWTIGTPEYMSPEQFMARPLDGRSDVYSLAIVLFRMLSGKFPFESITPQDIMLERMSDPPKTLDQVAPDLHLPAALQHVISRALRSEPEDRWPSATAFSEALTAVMREAGDPPLAGAVPQTKVASPQALAGVGVEQMKRSEAAPFRRLYALLGVVVVVGGVWGLYTVTTDGPDPQVQPQIGTPPVDHLAEGQAAGPQVPRPEGRETVEDTDTDDPTVVGPDRPESGRASAVEAEEVLARLEVEFRSIVEDRQSVPDVLAQRADSIAADLWDQMESNPAVQAHAAIVRAKALGFLENWDEAIRWAQEAVRLDPDNRDYANLLRLLPGGGSQR